ncbi:GMC oxidoreductase [Sodalis sp. RH19]|uniref:GMC oxidoreductase n=1 Tax=Sodalis sp. RH19 TaxID=3394334 RepID=UPI0039B5C9A2
MRSDIPAPDILIIGSGIGGATMAAALAPTGASILILEAGKQIIDSPHNSDQVSIFQHNYFKPDEEWFDQNMKPFRPGNYYNIGGNSKFYGAVLARYRKEDFEEMQHLDGVSPAWPFAYNVLEPWYSKAEQLYQVRGNFAEDPSEPHHSLAYPYPPIPDEPCIRSVRDKLIALGLKPYSLPLGVDIDQWRKTRNTPWDAHPHFFEGKMDAETAALSQALKYGNVQIQTESKVVRLNACQTTGKITDVEFICQGVHQKIKSPLVILSAGAIHSAVLLLRSSSDHYPAGLANSSDMVGRNFMNHNASALIAFSPTFNNDSFYQKTFGLNDFYLSDPELSCPLGNIQLLGRVSENILKSSLQRVPKCALRYLSKHSIDFYAMSEDLPERDNRVMIEGDKIILKWKRNNWRSHMLLVKRMKKALKSCGFPLVFSKPFDKRTPSHQCGTVRMGVDPKLSPLDPFCRAWNHDNLFVVDASFMPTSAAVNPSLTIAAQALRVADEIIRSERLASVTSMENSVGTG